MLTSINDNIRKQIYFNKTVGESINYILDLNDEDKILILRMLLSDFFKVNAIDLEVIAARKNLEIFRYHIDDLITTCIGDIEFLAQILKGAVLFYNSSIINKSIIMETMEAYDLDKISYTFSYELEDFKIYFLDYVEKNRTFGEKDSLGNEFLTDKMLDLKSFDIEKYKSHLLECIREYYKWNLFRKEKLKIESRFDGDYQYLSKIRDDSFINLIKQSSKDYNFLLTILVNYMYYSTLGNKEMNQIAENYLLKHSDEALQKKLQLKRD